MYSGLRIFHCNPGRLQLFGLHDLKCLHLLAVMVELPNHKFPKPEGEAGLC